MYSEQKMYWKEFHFFNSPENRNRDIVNIFCCCFILFFLIIFYYFSSKEITSFREYMFPIVSLDHEKLITVCKRRVL